MKRLLALTALLLPLSILAGCYGSTPPVVKIGLIAPFEELHRDDGYAALHAVRLAVDQRNAAGGVAGYRVALVALNDNARPDDARQAAANLGVDRDVLGVIGPLQGAAAQAAGPALAQRGLPWINLASQTPSQLATGFALEASPADVVARAGQALAAGGASGPVATTTDADFDPAGLAGLIWLGGAAEGARLAQRLPPEASLIGGPELGSPVFAGRAGAAANGAQWLSAAPAQAALPAGFVAAYQSLAGAPPSPQAVLAYDAANLLLDAMTQAGQQSNLSRETVQTALQALGAAGWQGLSGLLAWQSDACPAEQPCWPRLDPAMTLRSW